MKLSRSLSTILTAVALLAAAVFCGSAAYASPLHAAASPWHADHSLLMNFAFGGLVVNAANIQTIFLNLKATFLKAFDGAPIQWDKTAMLVPSTGAQNQYDWLDRFPDFRQWVGEKVVKNLVAYNYSLVNVDWESTIGVLRKDIEDDNLGIYAPITQDAGYRAKQFPDKLVSAIKNQAFVNLCYDGQPFYNANHPVGGGSVAATVVSNYLTQHLASDTAANAQASYGTARAMMMAYLDIEGQPLGLIPDTLEVPPALETVANTLMKSDFLGGAALIPNPYKGQCEVIVNPRLTSATAWFLHCSKRPIKPFIYQERKAPVFVEQITEMSDDVFNKQLFKFGAEARAVAGYGLWQMSVGSTGTV